MFYLNFKGIEWRQSKMFSYSAPCLTVGQLCESCLKIAVFLNCVGIHALLFLVYSAHSPWICDAEWRLQDFSSEEEAENMQLRIVLFFYRNGG